MKDTSECHISVVYELALPTLSCSMTSEWFGYFQSLQIGGVEHFAPAVGEGRLRRRIKKLPAEDQHAMVEEGLVDCRKGCSRQGIR